MAFPQEEEEASEESGNTKIETAFLKKNMEERTVWEGII